MFLLLEQLEATLDDACDSTRRVGSVQEASLLALLHREYVVAFDGR